MVIVSSEQNTSNFETSTFPLFHAGMLNFQIVKEQLVSLVNLLRNAEAAAGGVL